MSASLSPRFPATSTRPTRQRLDDLEALLQHMLDLPVDEADAKAVSVATEPEPATAAVERPKLTLLVPPVSSYGPPVEAANPPAAPNALADLAGKLAALRGDKTVESAPRPEVAMTEEQKPMAIPEPAPAPPTPVVAEREVIVSTPAAEPTTPTQPPTGDLPRMMRDIEGGTTDDWVPFSSNWRPSSQTWAPLRQTWNKGRPESAPATKPAAPAASAPNRTQPSALAAKVMQAAKAEAQQTEENPPEVTHAPDMPPLPWWALPFGGINDGFDMLVKPLGPVGRWLSNRGGKDFMGLIGILALAAAAGLMVADWYGWTW